MKHLTSPPILHPYIPLHLIPTCAILYMEYPCFNYKTRLSILSLKLFSILPIILWHLACWALWYTVQIICCSYVPMDLFGCKIYYEQSEYICSNLCLFNVREQNVTHFLMERIHLTFHPLSMNPLNSDTWLIKLDQCCQLGTY